MADSGYAFLNLPGGGEWFWIFLIFLVLFGASALPRLFRSLGKSMREFKKASDGLYDEMDKAADDEEDKKKAGKGADASAKKPAESKPPTNGDE